MSAFHYDQDLRKPSIRPVGHYEDRPCRECAAQFSPKTHNAVRCPNCRRGKKVEKEVKA